MSTAELLESWSHQIPGKLIITEYFFEVPLDHGSPENYALKLFARSVKRFEKPVDPSEAKTKQLPWRTGQSDTVTAHTLAAEGGPEKQAKYLIHFRADSIVEDCEAIRRALTADYPEEKKKWSIIGQSYGGFCCMTYLSMHPEGIQEAFICAGLAPLVDQPDPVYRRLYVKLAERNQAYYKKYPEDIQRVKHIVYFLQTRNIKLPSGGTLSIARLRQLGILFGFHGYLDVVHDIIYRMANDLDNPGYFTRPTLIEFEALQSFDSLPLYALIHELIYLQHDNASNWSADRIGKEYPAFLNLSTSNDEPIYFTGEMIFPSMFNDYDELRPLSATASILAPLGGSE
ncbi:MAG: hypothetical protein Q9219_007166 [cf. Caloplaca sp. 3 TL-2023]